MGRLMEDTYPPVMEDGLNTNKAVTFGSTLAVTGAITGSAGVVDFYCLWRPLSSDASITVTTPA